jgi:hypothetical protein
MEVKGVPRMCPGGQKGTKVMETGEGDIEILMKCFLTSVHFPSTAIVTSKPQLVIKTTLYNTNALCLTAPWAWFTLSYTVMTVAVFTEYGSASNAQVLSKTINTPQAQGTSLGLNPEP